MPTSLVDTIFSFFEQWCLNVYFCLEFLAQTCNNIVDKEVEKWLTFDYEVNFDKAQINALCFLIVFFLLNLISVLCIWRTHGQQIYKKFKKPATPKVFEELSRSLANLKLPKVHSPRL